MADTILLTGVTGNVGRATLAAYEAAGHPLAHLIGAAPQPEAAQAELQRPDFQLRALDFQTPTTFPAALAGIQRVFLLRPPQLANAQRDFGPFLQACRDAQVRQVVFLSLQGVENNPFTPHHGIEKLIRELKLPHTFLRPSFFMQNLSTTHRAEIRDRDEIFVPAGGGRTSFVDVRDVGAVAAGVLTQAPKAAAAHTLTGPKALSYAEVAELLSQALDRSIRYARPGALRFVLRKRREGLRLNFVLVMTALYTVCRLGWAGAVTPELEQLLGRPATSVATFIDDHLHLWQKA